MAIRKRIDGASAPIEVKPMAQTTADKNNIPPHLRGAVFRAIGSIGGLPPPKHMAVEDLLEMAWSCNVEDSVEVAYRERIRSPLTGIRAYCVLCQGGSPRAATNCANTPCSLWPFRLGKNPFYGKLNNANTESSD